MFSPSVEFALIAGRAVFLVFSFVLAAVAFAHLRRSVRRDAERVITQLSALDARLAKLESHVSGIDARLTEFAGQLEGQWRAPPARTGVPVSYPIAIRLARNGATCEELMESCGLGRQEAELVQRLHGPGKRGARARTAA